MKMIIYLLKITISVILLFTFTYCSSADNRVSNLSDNIAPGQTRIIGEISSINNSTLSKDGDFSIDAEVKIVQVIQRGSASTRAIAKGKKINIIFEYPSAVNPELVVGNKFKGDITELKTLSLDNNQDETPKYLIYVFDKLN